MGLFGKKKKMIDVYAPISGKMVTVAEIPDAVFSQKIVGDGVAIIPDAGIQEVLAPVDGEIVSIFPTGHAFGLRTSEGLEMLVHLGLETVELSGMGFEIIGTVGSKVSAGDLIIKMNVDHIALNNLQTISPVVIVNMHQVKELSMKELGHVTAGKDIIMTIEMQ